MKCSNCPDRKFSDALEQMEDGVEWCCMKKHSECEDVVCLLRMVIWEIAKFINDEDTFDNSLP